MSTEIRIKDPYQVPNAQELSHLSEPRALSQYLFADGYKQLRYLAIAAAGFALVLGVIALLDSNYQRLVPSVITLVLARGVFSIGNSHTFQRSWQVLTSILILAFLGLIAWMMPDFQAGLRVIGLVGLATLVAFKLETRYLVAVAAAMFLLTLAPTLKLWLDDNSQELPHLRILLQALGSVAVVYFARNSRKEHTQRFSQNHRQEARRRRERSRMRDELDSARQIQLSMLPAKDPDFPGLDVSGVSLPATEVGGDYYDYFEGNGRLAIVLADVAGHGVASGLVLSGMRSCLYMLYPDRPAMLEVVPRLDHMVRSTTEGRMFIAMLGTVIDIGEGRVEVVAAGNPPALLYRCATQDVIELGAPALPLGTPLKSEYQQVEAQTESGDVVVFYTDGLIETMGPSGDLFGDERLKQRLKRAAAAPEGGRKSRPARAIREALMSEVWSYKGDREQLDDVTLVVVRIE